VRAEIAGGHLDRAVAIPQTALHGDADVFLLEQDRLARRTVEVARRSAGRAFITGGLRDGDQVVTTRLDLMFEGMQVLAADE
jgi:multidrug efflux pump subunit AcrA (membrane-fusion protein)